MKMKVKMFTENIFYQLHKKYLRYFMVKILKVLNKKMVKK